MVTKEDYLMTKFHFLICGRLQKLYESVRDGKDENIIIECQPQIGKSVVTSELFPAWILGKENWPIVVASYGADLAEEKSDHCRSIVNSEQYRMVFPETRIRPETAAKGLWETTKGGAYRAVGVGGALSGFSGKVMIADDLFKDRAEADSETIRESTWSWWSSVFMSRKQGTTGVCLVNTRWHLQDIAGKLEKQYELDKISGKKDWEYDHWERFCFPAFAEEDEYIDGKLFRKKGEVLCPERFSYETMVRRRNNTPVYDWSSLYQQRPVLKENAKFKVEWFKYFDDEDIKTKELNFYTLVDVAGYKQASRGKKQGDNSVVMTVGKERTTGFWFVMDDISGRLDPAQTIDAIFAQVKKFPGTHVWIEAVGYQATLQFHLEERQRRDRQFFPVDPYVPKTTRSKESRIESLVQPFK